MHYYSQNIGDYRRDTTHLSLLEHGAYRQLIDTYYLTEKPLPLNHADLMRTHSARTADEMQAVENVLKDFFVKTEEGYIHKRCDVEIEAFHAKSHSASESAKARWDRVRAEKEANAMRTHSEGNANHKPITNNQEPDKSTRDQQADHVPYAGVFSAYETILHDLPQPRIRDDARKKAIKSIWRMDERFQNVDFFARYFTHVRKSPFLMSMKGIGFDWLMKPANFKKVCEGNYHEDATDA